ncbi:MAG: hypothetical protein KF912_10210 [Phycisphaeraceae bacterium]|nr:hypothetical protein [Phycisphaeraceae bacterium]MBX3367670.1 hypothetical protein [Phycisphaeraceae bacterium]
MAKRRTVRPSRVTEGPLSPDADASGTHGRPSLDEEPSDADVIRFNDDSTRCRRCKTLLYDDLDSCPRCGEDVASGKGRSMPWWVILALGLVLAAMVAPAILPVLLRLL